MLLGIRRKVSCLQSVALEGRMVHSGFEIILASLPRKVIGLNLSNELQAGLNRRLVALDVKLPSLKVECHSLRCAHRELDQKLVQLRKDLGNVSKIFLRDSIDGAAQMADVFGVPLRESLKPLQSDFRMKSKTMSKEMKNS